MAKISKAFAALGIVTGLGFGLTPLTSYADTLTVNPTLTVHVAKSIDIEVVNTSVSTLNINTYDIDESTMHTDLSVTVNGYDKYSITLTDEDNDTTLRQSQTAYIETNASLARGTSAWAAKVGTNGSWQAMPASNGTPIAVVTNATASTTNTATVYYGVSTSATQLAGTYTDTVIYTASASN